jgi:hypothetical protein
VTDLTPDAAKVWYCKVGEVSRDDLPKGSDAPMRDAVVVRYERITGREPDFIFSGWGATLTEAERAVVEDRPPSPYSDGYTIPLEQLAAQETLRGSGLAGDPDIYLLAVEEGQKALDRAHAAEAALDAERARAEKAENRLFVLEGIRRDWQQELERRREAEARNRNLEAAISQASYALNPNQGEPADPSLAHQWLRTTFPPDHPNYVDPAVLAVLEEPQ